jgi:hypothetical protein
LPAGEELANCTKTAMFYRLLGADIFYSSFSPVHPATYKIFESKLYVKFGKLFKIASPVPGISTNF